MRLTRAKLKEAIVSTNTIRLHRVLRASLKESKEHSLMAMPWSSGFRRMGSKAKFIISMSELAARRCHSQISQPAEAIPSVESISS
jgi:hypothetical protein